MLRRVALDGVVSYACNLCYVSIIVRSVREREIKYACDTFIRTCKTFHTRTFRLTVKAVVICFLLLLLSNFLSFFNVTT